MFFYSKMVRGRSGALCTNELVMLEGICSAPQTKGTNTGHRNGLPIESLWKFDTSASCALQVIFL